ncbi:MAG: TetR/AcrR family transcriptional regulator [Methanoregula sp.]|nr:TetR/AcrR family transcriptional regulator [Methanoregula sp.]
MPRINAEYREDAKKKIVAAAIGIAAETGWDAVTMESIAQKVGVTKGALYAYFENRDALLHAVILEVFANVRAGLVSTLADEEDIHRIILNLAEFIFEQQKPYATIFYQLPIRIPQDSQYREEFSQIFDRNRLVLRDCIERFKTAGKVPGNVDPEATSGAIIALTMGLRITSLFLGKDTDEAKKTWVDSVEKILGIGHWQ